MVKTIAIALINTPIVYFLAYSALCLYHFYNEIKNKSWVYMCYL